jgi:serine/threonine protein phosphatase PrpC
LKIIQNATTDVGRKRDHNEDYLLVDPELNLYIVCDGMGGHNAGEVASKMTAEGVSAYLKENIKVLEDYKTTPKNFQLNQLKELIKVAINKACHTVYEKSLNDPECQGMGTTFVMALVVNQVAIIAHVGDSRAYLLRGKKEIQITEDHSFVNEMVREGLLKREEAESHPNANIITRAIGIREFAMADIISIELTDHDQLILCSDGLSGYLSQGELLTISKNVEFENMGTALIQLANERGGKDNITVICLSDDRGASPPSHPDKVSAEDKERVLHQIPLFRKLNFKELSKILEVTEMKSYAPGEILIKENEKGENMHIIVRGKVKVENQNNHIADLGVGSFFGEMSLIDNRGRNATIIAEEKSSTLVIDRDPLLGLFKKDYKIGVKILWALIQNMNKRLRMSDEQIFELKKYFSNLDPDTAEDLKNKF